LRIARRLAEAAPDNADYARDLWVSCWRMADLAERESTPSEALAWWRQAYTVLSGMKQKGLFLSPKDEGFLRRLAAKVGA
jgi:hypothetical protein